MFITASSDDEFRWYRMKPRHVETVSVSAVRDVTLTKTGTVLERHIDENNRPEGLHSQENVTIYTDLCHVTFGSCVVSFRFYHHTFSTLATTSFIIILS
jgi:hypothetical protein